MNISIILRLLALMQQFRQREQWTRQLLEEHQTTCLARLREHAYTHAPFYQHFHRGLSEVLTPDTRRRVEQAWGQVLFNQYAATETGSIAAECEHHSGMHLFEDLLLIEVVDHQNRPLPAGVYGDKLLVTVLFNRTQPLIRYELSDSVCLSQAICPCGRPYRLIDAVQGRMEEVLTFPTATGTTVQVQPLVLSELMDTLPVSGWQIVQEANGLSVLFSGVREEFSEDALTLTIQQALTKRGVAVPPVTIQRVSAIPKTAQGKAPLIRSPI